MLTALLAALSAPEQDRVASLPGYGEPPSPQYSGYLDAGAAENLEVKDASERTYSRARATLT